MYTFTHIYDKTLDMSKSPQLHADWASTEAALKSLIQPGGPDVSKARVLDDLRKRLQAAARKGAAPASAEATEICHASVPGQAGFQDRAALIKQMKHFYLTKKLGNQSVWICDTPKSYEEWNYNLFSGKPGPALSPLPAQGTETFGPDNRKMMCDALQLARKWSLGAQVKLGRNSAAVDATIRRWFHEAGASDADVAATRARLTEGFKKITAGCNAGTVIFSDRPDYRLDAEKQKGTYALVNRTDRMPVIDLFPLFLEDGKRSGLFRRIPKLWACALTIVHELSHSFAGTVDIFHADDGLKPSAGFPANEAITNAESWAYFCGDVVKAIPESDVQHALR